MAARHTILCLLVLAVSAGCGFHLRGAVRLSPALKVAYLDAPDRYTDFHRSFVESLSGAGVTLVRKPEQAGAVIELKRDDSGQRVLSVSARNTPTQYEVYYTVTFRVRAGEQELQPAQTLSLTREYAFDETAQLAMDREEQVIREALARDLAALVMRRLAAL